MAFSSVSILRNANESAEALFADGDIDGALRVLQQSIESEPTNPLPILKAAQMLRMAGKTQQSREFYDRAVALADASEAKVNTRCMALALRGECLAQLGDTHAAKKDFESWLELEPKNPVALERVCMMNLEHAEKERDAASLSKAMEVADMALPIVGKDSPQAAIFYYAFGSALRMMGRTDLAIEALKDCVRVNEGHAPAYELLAMLHRSKGEIREAISNYKLLLKHMQEFYAEDPEMRETQNLMQFRIQTFISECNLDSGDLQDAIAYVTETIEQGKKVYEMCEKKNDLGMMALVGQELAQAHYLKSICLARNKQLEECVEESARAIEMNPAHVQAHLTKAQALEMLGRTKEAEEERKRAAKLSGKEI